MKRVTLVFALIVAFPVASDAAWDPSGNPVVVAPAAQDRLAAIPFGAGGVLVAWVDQRAGDPGDIYALALDAAGDPVSGWPAGGAPVCTAAGEQSQLSLVADATGGAYLRWIDQRTGTAAHALQRVVARRSRGGLAGQRVDLRRWPDRERAVRAGAGRRGWRVRRVDRGRSESCARSPLRWFRGHRAGMAR